MLRRDEHLLSNPAESLAGFPGPGFPVVPEIKIDWYWWSHVNKEFSEYEIDTTTTTTTIWCTEMRNCETLRFNYDDVVEEETRKALTNQYTDWEHQRLNKMGTNSWPIFIP